MAIIRDVDLIFIAGNVGLIGAFLCCLAILLFVSLNLLKNTWNSKKIAEVLSIVQTAELGLSVLSLGVLLQKNAFEYTLVYESSEISMSWIQKLGGLWAGQSSSILFWSFILSSAASISVGLSKKNHSSSLTPAILLIFDFILIFFLIPELFIFNPFRRIWALLDGSLVNALLMPIGAKLFFPNDGVGLNPSLRHIAMILHPPFIYSGLIGFFIPYAFALASIWKAKDDAWIKYVFPIALFAWIFLTIGMALGAWWAYTILGWGGYWGWDAVEISGLLPWILSFGLLHSMNMQLRGYPFIKWIYSLSALITMLILFGILLTRSGIIESIHSYSEGAMGPVLTSLLIINIAFFLYLFYKHWKKLENTEVLGSKSPEYQLTNLFNVLLVILAIFFLFGQTLPLTSQLISGKRTVFSPDQYKMWSAPVFILIILLTAFYSIVRYLNETKSEPRKISAIPFIVSLSASLLIINKKEASFMTFIGFCAISLLLASLLNILQIELFHPLKKFIGKHGRFQNWHQLGYILIHLGFALLCLGIVSVESFTSYQDILLGTGETIDFGTDQITGQSQAYQTSKDGHERFELNITLTRQNEKNLPLVPFMEYYPTLNTVYNEPDQQSNLLSDIQAVIRRTPETLDNKIAVRMYRFPLMAWIWIGCAMMAAGGICSVVAYYPHPSVINCAK
ncbi:MAG: cytochrome c biogenesis protein CcsA [Anaerolineaceae bacterium]|nr:cytochrome c biogenesis protein CcsA [Anaerolineaceae bacterium]